MRPKRKLVYRVGVVSGKSTCYWWIKSKRKWVDVDYDFKYSCTDTPYFKTFKKAKACMEKALDEYVVTCFPMLPTKAHPVINVVIFNKVDNEYRIESLFFEDWIKDPSAYPLLEPMKLMNDYLKQVVKNLIEYE